jgi:hypothetical protein
LRRIGDLRDILLRVRHRASFAGASGTHRRVSLARLARALLLLLMLVWTGRARAEILHLPVGGRPVQLGDGRVFCEAVGPAFGAEAGARTVRPPSDPDLIGSSVNVRVAPTAAACDESTASVSLVAIGKLPEIDRGSVWFAPDEGRLDADGSDLLGTSVVWKSGSSVGVDTCNAPRALPSGKSECSWSVARGVSIAPEVTQFFVLPAGARTIDDALFFDLLGRKVSNETFAIHPVRTTLLRVVMPDASVDLSTGQGEIPLAHPEAVASAECGALSCEMIGGKLMVRGGSSAVRAVEVQLRLVPDVFVFRDDAFLTTLSVKLPAMHCPMTIVSGSPFRDAQDAKVIVRMEGRCGKDIGALSFTREDRPLKTLDIVRSDYESYAVLRLGEIGDETLTLHAVRGAPTGVVVASVQAQTSPAPQVRATLELAGHKNLSMIPNNRATTVHVAPAGERLRFQILPIEGVYRVIEAAAGSLIQADPNAAGLTSLRFGIRTTHLPDRLNKVDLATVNDPLQRGTAQVNVPVPIAPAEGRPTPLVEVWCGGGNQPLHTLTIGNTAHLPFALRDTCRVVFHRELLPPEFGTQKLNFEIEILRSDGSIKPEGHVAEVVTLRTGEMPRYAWISGVSNPFERITVRVSHVADENHYLGAEEVRTGAPAAQWSAVMGTGHVRLYGTTTIPTGLYRFSSSHRYNGTLGLNFGVISRLTWLDEEGHEGLLGAEAGVLVFGLANTAGSPSAVNAPQVGAVMGLGLAVPIANRSTPSQASINLHAWFEITLSDVDPKGRYALVFGPSISIGSVGVNL